MAMTDIIKSLRDGTLLVRRGTSLPETVKIEGHSRLGNGILSHDLALRSSTESSTRPAGNSFTFRQRPKLAHSAST